MHAIILCRQSLLVIVTIEMQLSVNPDCCHQWYQLNASLTPFIISHVFYASRAVVASGDTKPLRKPLFRKDEQHSAVCICAWRQWPRCRNSSTCANIDCMYTVWSSVLRMNIVVICAYVLSIELLMVVTVIILVVGPTVVLRLIIIHWDNAE